MFICQNWHPYWDERREFGHMIMIMIPKSLSYHIFLDLIPCKLFILILLIIKLKIKDLFSK